MLSVDQARQLVIQHIQRRPIDRVALTPAALGLVLAEDVASDLDMPPYDKALVDGFAVRTADLSDGDGLLTISEEIVAGRTPQKELRAGQAAQIMTGAVVPAGADAVVMVERTELLEGQRVRVLERSVKVRQNILGKGREMRRGDTVLRAGAILRPQELGLLSVVGRTVAAVHRRPVAAVVSTGDEVVEPALLPAPGQIRNSNAAVLSAQVTRAGATPRYLGIARDTLESLRPLASEGLQADLLILSGGVSAGKLDLVPAVLEELGVQPIFHKVAMKPGKPLFFGTKQDRLVFGLPGNPVSSLVGFEVFVRPALRLMQGRAEPEPRMLTAAMTVAYCYETDRPTYHPARLELAAGGWHVTPVPWFGSPDLRAITQANAFIVFAIGTRQYRQGDPVQVLAPEHDW
jgi:molybdopterin molybdotransferase